MFMSKDNDFMSKISEAFSKQAKELGDFSEEALLMSKEAKNSTEGTFWFNLSIKLNHQSIAAVENNHTTMKEQEVLASIKNKLH
jgi:hypothetical protein